MSAIGCDQKKVLHSLSLVFFLNERRRSEAQDVADLKQGRNFDQVVAEPWKLHNDSLKEIVYSN